MAGRNVGDAVANYRADLQRAFRCLNAFVRVDFLAPDHSIGAKCSWLLLGPGEYVGIELPGCPGTRFEASQTLEIVECDPAKYGGRVRLTTRSYDYSVGEPGKGELWAMHWHPDSQESDVDYPHIHLRRLFGPGAHLATSRLLVEHAIHWAIEGGATPRYESGKWQTELQETILNHMGESTWSVSRRSE
ncbi:hypothetical protein BST20_22410 [Mycobacterium branderi]|uniref:Uncharacterized protein n=1 Tax=Mycobacterium branderi TaxID=43348 RepID=A0A7I7W1Y5_9MYCO|nr:hypothetical protein BST20_22410 [Mycobacterium branderi]BBZ11589.1 hypothetical protein MBRA_17840 [Mycobacterium branderi]